MALFANERKYDAIVASATAIYPVPADLVRAVIARESAFNPRAIRAEPQINDASRGLMQVLYNTARGIGFTGKPDDLYYPEINIPLGTRYLWEQYRRAGTWAGAVSAYNGGWRPTLGFGRPLASGKFRNQKHVDAVMRFYTYFRTGKVPASPADMILPALAIGALAFVVTG